MANGERPWWSTWPGALGAGLATLVLGSAGWLALLIFVTLPIDNQVGVDRVISSEVPVASVVAAWAALAVLLALPVLTTVWARRIWLGYTLLGLGMGALGGVAGLLWSGVL
ncbi:MAG TPA: hypothetical protein PKE40_14130 [Arachnia sp.]|mgnify:CR=1 FL=1|nr:hypothetical protein [Arachnia sp.]HMT87481.1 hypothetical protein [Arachnia sp.]